MAARKTANRRQTANTETPQPVQYVTSGTSSLTKILLPALIVLLVASSFLIGVLWTKLSYAQKGVTSAQAANPETAANAGTGGGQAAGAADIARQPSTVATLDTIKNLFSKDLIKFGKGESPVLFVEVADTSCPYCHVAAGKNPALNKEVGARFTLVSDGGSYVAPVPEMKKLVDAGTASFVYIYTPGHGNGEMGAKALYCAYEKGRFWEVHDLLMNNKGYDVLNQQVKNDKTKSSELAEFLSSAMPVSEMKACLDSGKYDNKPSEDTQIAASIGVQGTPGFFVNASPFNGAYSWTDMKSVVDAALKQ
ncbi:MAG: DsbA family protein [Candidatus Blackburnbacteria bacterium]|nr:DsbA family protein [Candidatus Blackburnbacteria bacterium]